jgi:hypothetical protein
MGERTPEERMALMEQRQDYFAEQLDDFKGTVRYASRLLTGTLISTVVTLIVIILRM